MSLGFWSKSKKGTTAGGGTNPLKVDAIFATDDSGSMNSYLAWEDDPKAVDAFNLAMVNNGIGAKNLEIVDDNNANRISRTFFATYKQQILSNLYLVRTNANLSGASISLGSTFTISRGGNIVGSAGDYVVYSWDVRTSKNNPNTTFNEFVFKSATGGAGTLENVEIGDTIASSGGTAYGSVTYVERLDNPYRYYVAGDLRLQYFWAQKNGPNGSYTKNSADGGATGANSEDAFGIIHKTIGVSLNGTQQPDGSFIYDDYKPRAASKLVFIANTNEHDTAMPYSVDNTRDLLLSYNGVYIGNIGGYGADYGPGIFPHIRNPFDYNGGTNGVPAADPRGFQPISNYVSDVFVETVNPVTSLNGIPDGWYRGVEFEIKDVESVTSSAAVQARHRPKIRLDLKVSTPAGESNKTVTVLKVVFPGYGYVVGDTITPPTSTTTSFGSLHDKLVLRVVRTKTIDYTSASKKLFCGVYTKDFNRIVFLNQHGPATNVSIVSGGSGYVNATGSSTTFDIDQASGFNNAGEGTGLTVNITQTNGVVTGATVNTGGTLYNVNDKVIVQHPDFGAIIALASASLVGGSGYGANQTVTGASLGNLSDLANGAGATVNYTTDGSGAITSVTLNDDGINYQEGDVLFIQGGNNDAQITVDSAKENCIVQVTSITAASELRERSYLVRDINLITRNNDPPTGSIPQTGAVEVIASNQFTVNAVAGSNVLTVTGTGTGAALANINVGDSVWNNANTTAGGTKTGTDTVTMSPTVPWDVVVTAVDAVGGTITIDAACNATASVNVWVGVRRSSSAGWRWDHTTLARETGGAIFFQVGPFSTPIGNAPGGVAYWDNSGGNTSYGSHAWETVAVFGDLGASNPDYRVQFGRTIGKTVGEYLFKTA